MNKIRNSDFSTDIIYPIKRIDFSILTNAEIKKISVIPNKEGITLRNYLIMEFLSMEVPWIWY